MPSNPAQRKPLTQADVEALEAMPADGWFDAGRLLVNRPWYRCQRLEAAGYLESRAELEGLHARLFYRRIKLDA